MGTGRGRWKGRIPPDLHDVSAGGGFAPKTDIQVIKRQVYVLSVGGGFAPKTVIQVIIRQIYVLCLWAEAKSK